MALEYDLSGDNIYVGDNQGNISMINEHTEKETRSFQKATFFNNGHSNRIFSIKQLNDNPNIFLTGGWDGMVFLWDVRDEKPIKHFDGFKISGNTIDYKNGKILIGSYE